MQIIEVNGSKPVRLGDTPTAAAPGYEDKDAIKKQLKKNIKRMAELQSMLYAQDRYAMLLVFQAMDAAGKDGMIRRVMTGLNPQGTQVFSFKKPSEEEIDHDYLWRPHKCMPERGRIGIFNRSYYEEVLVVRVHNLVEKRRIPSEFVTDDIWRRRFNHIRNFEEYITHNGIVTLKFFLHVGKDEQKSRFISRIDDPAKNWKFSEGDIYERQHWDEYQQCYEEAINETGTEDAPWYVIPSDNKWYARLVVSEIITQRMQKLNLHYPKLPDSQLARLGEYRAQLMKEGENA